MARLVLILGFLAAASAYAAVPEATIRRIVELKVQAEENRLLFFEYQQIDHATNTRRTRAIDAELKTLYRPINRLPRDAQRQTQDEINGLLRARLAILLPQWQARAEAFKKQKAGEDRAARDALSLDVRAAVEAQRRRLVLQQRRDRGEISATEFARDDKKALDEIMALRARHARQGDAYARRFDQELQLMTRAVATDPAVPLPESRVPPGAGGTTIGDYEKDVRLAADLLREKDQASRRFWEGGRANPDAMRETENILGRDIQRLMEKWKAAGKGTEFYNDYVSAYRSGGFASGGTPSSPVQHTSPQDAAGYENDVRRAADIIRQKDVLEQRPWPWQARPDPDEIAQKEKPLADELRGLNEKWIAAGRGGQFYSDYLRLVRPPQKPLAERLAPAAVLFMVLGLLGFLYLLSWLFRGRSPVKRTLSTIYGSAHYAPLETDVADEACLANGLFLGKSSHPDQAQAPLNGPGAPVCSTPEHHTLIVARTRTGKGTRVIVPTLLRYKGSALVIDPKGENAAITARVRKDQLGQSIHILNPWDVLANAYAEREFTPATCNPLDALDRDDPNAVAVANSLSSAICFANARPDEAFWWGSAANLLSAVLLWLTDQPGETRNLARVREIISLPRDEFVKNYATRMAASDAFAGAVREMSGAIFELVRAPETYAGVMTNLREATKFISDPRVKAATARSSFAMEDLSAGKTTVFVVIPPGQIAIQKTWLRLVIAAGMNVFKNPKAGTLGAGHRCLFLIDEFPALGRIDDIPNDIATMSGFGVDFALVVQGLDQLKHHYGEAQGAILSNCAYKWFCNVSDLQSAKWLSDTLGKTTVGTTSTSDSFSSSAGNKSSSGHSTTHAETSRLLLTPDEVLTLGRDVAIALQPDGHPHYLKPVDYWKLTEAFSGLREKHRQLYWDPELAYDENPYFAKKKKEQQQPPPSGRNGRMTRKEALEIMELTGNPTREEIEKAYKRLMVKVHPDHGGSNWFAKELNEAKEVLLGP